MVKEGGMVRVDGARNLLVLAGTGADHEAWLETIRTFDVDWLANKSVAVFRIGNMPAETMVRSLTEILRNENVNEQMVRFMALDSGNAVLAVARTPQILEATRGWVRRIEIAGGQQLQLFSYQMRYAQASQALPILSKIFGVQGASEAELSSLGVAARLPAGGARGSTARPASGMPVGTGGFGASSPPSSLAQTTMAPGGNGAGAGAQPTSMTGARTQAFSGFGNGNGNGGGDGHMPTSMRLIANEPTNTLLIYATDEDYKKVRNVLRTVDVPPRQVLVEATIVEVALTDELRYGVQYYLNGRLKGTPIDVALTNGDFRGIGPEAPGFGMALGAPAKVVIDALTTMTQVTVVSAPTVMVLNNQSARLVVGDQVPIATQNRTDPLQPNLVTVNTIELRDTGVIFEVTPRINSSGSVLLDINQEVSSVQRQADPTLTPTISQRKLASSVTVEHGETIVLGGLFSNQKETGRTGLPGLSQLPLVGGAFGRTTTGGGRTELIVLITPKIVNNKYETRAATNEMRRRIQELRFEDANVHEKPIAPPPVVVETPVPATPVDVKPLDPPCADPCAAPHGRSAHWPTTSSIDRPQAAPTPATEPQPVLRGSRASRNGG
jgi:general secretion pathway protein D